MIMKVIKMMKYCNRLVMLTLANSIISIIRNVIGTLVFSVHNSGGSWPQRTAVHNDWNISEKFYLHQTLVCHRLSARRAQKKELIKCRAKFQSNLGQSSKGRLQVQQQLDCPKDDLEPPRSAGEVGRWNAASCILMFQPRGLKVSLLLYNNVSLQNSFISISNKSGHKIVIPLASIENGQTSFSSLLQMCHSILVAI